MYQLEIDSGRITPCIPVDNNRDAPCISVDNNRDAPCIPLFAEKEDEVPFSEWCYASFSLLGQWFDYIKSKPTVDEIAKAGIIPMYLNIIHVGYTTELQVEAAFALVQITVLTVEHAQLVAEHHAVPMLASHLKWFDKNRTYDDDSLLEQVALILGNIALVSQRYSDLVLEHGAFESLVSVLKQPLTLAILRATTWTLSILCHSMLSAPLEKVKAALPVLRELIYFDDDRVVKRACWSLFFLSQDPSEKVQAFIEVGVCPRLVDLLQHPSETITMIALETLGNLVFGNNAQMQSIIDVEALPHLYQLLTEDRRGNIKEYACRTISRITAGNRAQVQAVMKANIFIPLAYYLKQADDDVKSLAAWAISNATSKISHEQIWSLVSQDCIKPLCDLLTCNDPMIVKVCLEGLDNILEMGEGHKMRAASHAFAQSHLVRKEGWRSCLSNSMQSPCLSPAFKPGSSRHCFTIITGREGQRKEHEDGHKMRAASQALVQSHLAGKERWRSCLSNFMQSLRLSPAFRPASHAFAQSNVARKERWRSCLSNSKQSIRLSPAFKPGSSGHCFTIITGGEGQRKENEVLEEVQMVGYADGGKMRALDRVNIYAIMVNDCDGFKKIENLRTHDNNDISEKAVKILERYCAGEKIGMSGSPDWWGLLAKFSLMTDQPTLVF